VLLLAFAAISGLIKPPAVCHVMATDLEEPTESTNQTGESLALRTEAGMRLRPIIIYFNGTFVRRENGAHSRVAELIRFALDQSEQVILYSYANHWSCPWGSEEINRFRREFPRVRLFLDRRSPALSFLTRLKAWLVSAWPQLADWVINLSIPGLTPRYDELCAITDNPLLIVNYASGLVELNGVRRRQAIIETHDLQFLSAAKALGRKLTAPKTMLRARCELELLSHATALIAIASPETGMFRLFYPGLPVFFIPTYGRPILERISATVDFRYDLLFVGSENALNIAGLCGFIEEHRAWLKKLRFAIAGRICLITRLRDAVRGLEGVDLVGYVEDLAPIFRSSKVVISPVDGTGLKIKVIDALAAGKPVFGSRQSLEALPAGFNQCVFPLSESGIDALLKDDQARQAAERDALSYASKLVINGDLLEFRAYLATKFARA